MRSGIQPLDERLGGLRAGGLYLLAGVPGSGRLLAVLHFLTAGLEEGERVALLTATGPERVLEQAGHWGMDLRKPWLDGQLRILSYRPEFERRLLSAAEPGEVFDELGELLGPRTARLGIHPGAPLWESRSGTSAASHFVRWAESIEATCWATLASDLEDTLSAATEWVLGAATGVFHLERSSGGLHELRIRHLSPPADAPGPITLASIPGRGLGPPSGEPARRRTDVGAGSEGRLALVRLATRLPSDLEAWAATEFEVVEETEPLGVVERMQEGERFGVVLLFVERGRVQEAVRATRVLHGLTPAPILVATDDRLRSADRVRALEAGASDVIDAPLTVPELASRIERACHVVESGERPERREPPPAGAEEVLAAGAFARLVRERLSRPAWCSFALLRLSAPGVPDGRMGAALLGEIRSSAGDAVGRLRDGYGVVLAGARSDKTEAFLGRVRGSLGEGGAGRLEAEAWSGLGDRDRIEALLTESDPASPSPDRS